MSSAAALQMAGDTQRTASQELGLPTRIPYSSEIAPGVVKLKGGAQYLCGFEISGVDFETCSESQLDAYARQLEQGLLTLEPGSAVWTHRIRRPVELDFRPELTASFAKELHTRYMQTLKGQGMTRTELYLFVLYRPTHGPAPFKSHGDFVREEQSALEAIRELKTRLSSSLRVFEPRELIDYVNHAGVKCSELSRVLHFLINGWWSDIPLTHSRLDAVLASSRLTFADRSGVIRLEQGDGATRYASAIEIQRFPDESLPRTLSKVLYLGQEFVETQSFGLLDNRAAIERLGRQRNLMFSGGEASEQEVEDLGDAIEQLRQGRIGLGEYHYSLMVFHKSLQDVKTDRAAIQAALESAGLKTVVQTTVPEAAWHYQCPGSWSMRTRVALMTTANFSALSPLHNFMAGKPSGNPWGGAVAVFEGSSGQPHYFNFHPSPKNEDATGAKIAGNTTIFGSTGSGKTTVEGFLICMLTQYNARVVVLDMDRSTEITVRALGGKYKSFFRGIPTGINPFRWMDTPVNRAFCKRLVLQLITGGVQQLFAQDANRLSAAVDTVFELPEEQRRLGIVEQNLPASGANSLRERLARWVGEGELAWVLDNPKDNLDLSSTLVFGFDYSEFIDDPEICPVFAMCLLQATEGLKDGRPLAIFMEEFWKPLRNPTFSDFVRDQLKTIRKENGIVILTTQQPDDVLDHPLAKTAVQQASTGIYLPNPNAYRDDYIEFGLTDEEYEIVRALPVDSRAFLVKQGGKSALVRFDLSDMRDMLMVLSGNLKTVLRLDAIRVTTGDDPYRWLPVFTGNPSILGAVQ